VLCYIAQKGEVIIHKIMGTLYIVPTPIGNLEDITLRALRVLREVALIAAEDTRATRILLQHYDIHTPLTSYHEHNKIAKLDAVFEALSTGDVALVSDAGTPGISDPGYELIQTAIQQGYRVEPLPGANALIPALVASGLPTDGFVYLGFLPKKDSARREFLMDVSRERRTLIAYESPHRLVEALQAIEKILGNRQVCVAREISKIYEEFFRGKISDAVHHYQQSPPRGEIVLLIGGAPAEERAVWDEAQVQKALYDRLARGDSLAQASKAIASESGWDRRAVYALGVDREK
jgi:16S rRNA (cytidine1402-2'-O)-methyltransferase